MSRRLPWLASLLPLGAGPPVALEHGIGNVHMDISCGTDANETLGALAHARYDAAARAWRGAGDRAAAAR